MSCNHTIFQSALRGDECAECLREAAQSHSPAKPVQTNMKATKITIGRLFNPMSDHICQSINKLNHCVHCGKPIGQPPGPSLLAAANGSELLPCPFCGGTAESDTMQGFRRMKDGALSNAVAIYCTKCSAQITMCHDDHPEYFPSTLLEVLREEWNVRVPNGD